jgi:TolB protein
MKFTTMSLRTIVCLVSLMTVAATAQSGRIAFVSDETGSWQLYTMNPDGSSKVRLTNLAHTDFDLWAPSIAPDGDRIAFTYGTGSSASPLAKTDLFVMNSDGSGLKQITHDQRSIFPRWSPDGKKLIFTRISERTNATGVVTLMNADGTGPLQPLTDDLWDSFGAFYTPDGEQIIFYSQKGGLIAAVWIMNKDGSKQRRLTAPALMAFPSSISPDGQTILFGNNGNSPASLSNDLFVMDRNGHGTRQLTHVRRTHHDGDASFSPDGSSIAFRSDRLSSTNNQLGTGPLDIFVMRADGSDPIRILTHAGTCPDGNCVNPFWGPER